MKKRSVAEAVLGHGYVRRIAAIAFLLCVLGAGRAVAQVDPDFETVLQNYIKVDNTSLEDAPLKKIVANWPGNQTIAGLRAVVEELLQPTGGTRRVATGNI